MSIRYLGISTHNLKHIDFSLESKKITLIKGVSGCGKSSLAIDTIYKISADEMAQLTHCETGISSYSIDGYTGIIPAICLRQENFNTNPRSTIGTYFSLNQYIINIFSYITRKPHVIFQFSNPDVSCKRCRGLGTVPVPSINNFVDCFSKLSSRCFRIWNTSDSEFYSILFNEFCKENHIPMNCCFNDLSEKQQELILYGESKDKRTIRYKCNGKIRTRVGRYRGPMVTLNELINNEELTKSNRKYFNDETCPDCHGSRFSDYLTDFTFNGRTLPELYLMEFGDLFFFISKSIQETSDKFIKQQCQLLLIFLNAAINIRLDYLTLNRTIPSLSGGEFQRISLAKASVVQFNGFLYVLDEPVSALHPAEYSVVTSLIQTIRNRGNSILIIEHSDVFDSIADKVVYLGPEAGKKGGNIVSKSEIKTTKKIPFVFFQKKGSFHIDNAFYNNVRINSLQIPTGTLVGICGISGSGKSTFIRDILPYYIKKSVILNQSAIRGNCYSLVATAINVMGDIEKYFSKNTNKDIKYFWFSSLGPGQCPVCHGSGILSDQSIGWKSEFSCPACKGKRFSKISLSYKVDGLSIYDFLNLDIDTILEMIPKDSTISKKLRVLSKLGLGYINLFQNTETLSGGEIQRLKMANAIIRNKKSSALLLDEPFRGLDEANVNKLLDYIYELVNLGCSIFMVEHIPYVLAHCSYIIEFGPGSGKHGGNVIYNGSRADINRCRHSLIAPFISDARIFSSNSNEPAEQ